MFHMVLFHALVHLEQGLLPECFLSSLYWIRQYTELCGKSESGILKLELSLPTKEPGGYQWLTPTTITKREWEVKRRLSRCCTSGCGKQCVSHSSVCERRRSPRSSVPCPMSAPSNVEISAMGTTSVIWKPISVSRAPTRKRHSVQQRWQQTGWIRSHRPRQYSTRQQQ